MYRHRTEYRITKPKHDYVIQRRVNSDAESAWVNIAKVVDEKDTTKVIDQASRADIAAATRLGFTSERSGDNVYVYIENVTWDGEDSVIGLRMMLNDMDIGTTKTHKRYDIMRNLYGYIILRDGRQINTVAITLDEAMIQLGSTK